MYKSFQEDKDNDPNKSKGFNKWKKLKSLMINGK
jgi:hypothetical protein